ncbi:hypothetical protein B0J11DRAFT_600993 [Dendryphion nanum]|uniref:Uncharacterized protein n=1 Tax=Dendryphion nanum TaxID=256645 RepID=A0A9P9E4U6_9PLEO|nr:hypothetical protein B0J11DRAFT_600993 [Dendryphion nanum]
MKDNGEKRKARSCSSSEPTQTKRVRNSSTNTPDPSKSSRYLRAKSVFRPEDPYIPRQGSEATPILPTAGDWKFRLKVLCSDSPSDDILKEAIQGLVMICFPEKVLDELGIDVVQTHMEQSGATEHNIARMRGIFQAEMIHRVAWMLSEYLDTVDKIEVAVLSVLTASNQLHSEKYDDGILSEIIGVFQRFRDQTSANGERNPNAPNQTRKDSLGEESSEKASSQENSFDEDSSDEDSSDEDSSQNDTVTDATKVTDKPEGLSNDTIVVKHENTGYQNRVGFSTHDTDIGEPKESNSVVTTTRRRTQPPFTKEKKVNVMTSTRRWDVDPARITLNDIPAHFKRRTDLYAYHAYPIIKRDLGPDVPDVAVLAKIEENLKTMAKDEKMKWGDSLEKLRNGDLSILDRDKTVLSTREIRDHSFILNPNYTGRKENKIDRITSRGEVISASTRITNEHELGAATLPRTNTNVHEPNLSDTRHLSDKLPTGPVRNGRNRGAKEVHMSTTTNSNQWPRDSYRLPDNTPIVNLLLGGIEFDYSERNQIARMLTEKLSQRISSRSIQSPQFNGTTVIMMMSSLRHLIVTASPQNYFRSLKFRRQLEQALIPWVMAELSSFRELTSKPFIFSHMMPFTTPVLDFVCLGYMNITDENSKDSMIYVTTCLKERGIQSNFRSPLSKYPLNHLLGNILYQNKSNVGEKRARLEQILRTVAFYNRTKIPELYGSVLVNSWEAMTGMKWNENRV